MVYKYWVECFERELVIDFENASLEDADDIEETVHGAYCYWHDLDSIEDKEEREYVEASCLDEYIIECLENVGYKIKEWHSEQEE